MCVCPNITLATFYIFTKFNNNHLRLSENIVNIIPIIILLFTKGNTRLYHDTIYIYFINNEWNKIKNNNFHAKNQNNKGWNGDGKVIYMFILVCNDY